MKVKKNTLLLIACLVWTIAGANILKIGLCAYPPYLSLGNCMLSILVFCLFHFLIFRRLVKKHTSRISGYTEEYLFFLKFFDIKSFIIMAIMMTGGIYLRASSLVPDQFIAVFYTGLGASLSFAGILFGVQYIKVIYPQAKR